MVSKLTDEEVVEMADDIDNLYGLQHGHFKSIEALTKALKIVIATIDDKFPGMRQIIIEDLRESADRERRIRKHLREMDGDEQPTDDDIEEDLAALEEFTDSIEIIKQP